MACLARTLAALVLTTGVAMAAPQPVRADSFGFAITTDGNGRDHRGSRGHGDRRSWHDGRGGHGHHRGGPPPWARGPGPYRGPYAYANPYAYAPRCQLEWSWWYHSYVQVCR